MTDYKHIVERLRRKAEIDRLLERPDSAELLDQAANAIETLCEANERMYRMVESSFEVVRRAEEMAIRFAEAEKGKKNAECNI